MKKLLAEKGVQVTGISEVTGFSGNIRWPSENPSSQYS